MATTLPTYTRTVDQAFVSTWYDIKAEAIDNILKATVVTAALRDHGCFQSQVGGEYITETVRYGTKPSEGTAKGYVLPSGENELETLAMWTWRYTVSHIQRSLFDDQKNSGPSRIKSLVKTKIQAARESLEQQIEIDFLRDATASEAGIYPQSLYDMMPAHDATPHATYGVYGKLNRAAAITSGIGAGANAWWASNYKAWSLPREVNMLSDMSNLYNTCAKGLSKIKLILTDQTTFELYETYAEDKVQLVKDESTNLANLGYEVLRYKGKPVVWTETIGTSGHGTAGDMLMLNTDFIKVVYDPMMWFDMTEFKEMPKQAERLAHIFVAWNLISGQLRRHGQLYLA